MRLSVCLLTRNEEQNVPRAIGSVRSIADQIIVADTGSSDRTVQVAKDLGAEVYPVAWQDDFAAGCNLALSHARGEWVLWLNPDEELLPVSPFEMDAFLLRVEVLAYMVPVRDLPQAKRTDWYSETMQQRLFRRAPEVQFFGRTSPHFFPTLEALAQQSGRQIDTAPLVILRHAYLSQLTPDKLRWVARLQELELRDRPGQLHQLIAHGHTLLLLNEPRGHEVLALAAEQLSRHRNAPQAPGPDAQRLLEYLMTVSPEQSRSPLSAADARELSIRWFPFSPPMLWRNAEYYFAIGQYRAAALLLERLVEMARTGNYDRSQAFDPAILAEPTRMNLAVCYLHLGRLDQAEQLLQILRGHTDYRERAETNLKLLEQLRQQGQKSPA